MDRYDLMNKLEEYADAEDTESGEYWRDLARLIGHDYMMSENFCNTLCEEAEKVLQFIEENFEWREEERTVTRKYREFVPKNV